MTLAEILEELGIEYRTEGQHEHVGRGWLGVDCPSCGPNSGHFRLGFKGRAANCWQCGRMSQLSALHEITGRPWQELKDLLRLSSTGLPQAKSRGRGTLKLPVGVTGLMTAHRTYLVQRGFNPTEIVRLWNVQAIGVAPQLQWRLFIPVEREGQTVTWTTRSLADEGHRYVSAKADQEAVPIKQTLYGEDYVRHAAIVVEGPTDVWRVGPGAVATFGTAWTKAQVARLSRFPVRVICYDAEPAAQASAKRLCRELSAFPGQTHRVILDASDPGAATRREIRELRRMFLGGLDRK